MDKSKKALITISALSISLSASAALVPALASIGGAFPEWGESWLQYLITIPPLTMMISSLLTNRMLGLISEKRLTAFSVVLITFSGVSPLFISSFIYLLISRVLMGLGLGILNTIVSSLPVAYFERGQARDVATGMQAAFISAGGIFFSLFTGWLATKNWRSVFIVQLINIVPLFVALFFMPESPKPIKMQRGNNRQIFVKEGFSVALLSFICIAITCTFPLNLSLFAEKSSLGDATFVGLLASINAGIGFAIGLIFAKLMRVLKKLTLPLGLGLSGISLILVAFSPNKGALLMGSMLFGIGTSVISPALFARLYEKVPPKLIIPAVGMLSVGSNLSQFLSPFIINPIASLFGKGEMIRFVVAGGGILAISLLLVVRSVNKKDLNEG